MQKETNPLFFTELFSETKTNNQIDVRSLQIKNQEKHRDFYMLHQIIFSFFTLLVMFVSIYFVSALKVQANDNEATLNQIIEYNITQSINPNTQPEPKNQ